MEKSADRKPRRLSTALAGAALGIGGLTGSLFLLGQTAGAEVAAAPNVAQSAETVAVETVDAVNNSAPDAAEWAAFDGCLVDQGVISAEDLEAMYAEDWEGDDAEFDEEWAEILPNVVIESGDELTFADFGEGDGTVTISKVGDKITVTSDGDVVQETIEFDDVLLDGGFDEEFNEDFIDSEFLDGDFTDEELDAEFEAWEAAFEACEDLAPEGAFDYEDGDVEDGVFEDGDYDEHSDDVDGEDIEG